jgi:hypothetical protein
MKLTGCVGEDSLPEARCRLEGGTAEIDWSVETRVVEIGETGDGQTRESDWASESNSSEVG